MEQDYRHIIEHEAGKVFAAMEPRTSPEDMTRLRRAFQLAVEAHAPQKRKTGEPYILHPIAVALIAAEELSLDVNTVIASFLHDVVEDTPHTIEEISELFGEDVAFLVNVVTKKKKDKYEMSKQLDNFKQMLNSIQHDLRAIMVKLADRLHNMRTLSSMQPDKQMKIAGETDYFYAPLANRLGLYNVKTELENLSLRFRCPNEYEEIVKQTAQDEAMQHDRLTRFVDQIKEILDKNGIRARVFITYRQPYSLWRKMNKYGDDFNHLRYRHFTEVIFPDAELPEGVSEKDMALRIYSLLTDRFREKPGGISNYIDSPKENGYQCFHVKLLADFGRWQEIHISSERMIRDSRLGCLAERSENNIGRWIEKFRSVLRDISENKNTGSGGSGFIENVVTTFYNDDILTFTPQGREVVLPQKATVIDFAYEIHPDLGNHVKYARINNQLSSIKSPLRRGDVVEVVTGMNSNPQPDWLDHTVTYKAKKAIRQYLARTPKPRYARCPVCMPIPGDEVIGFHEEDGNDTTVHKRDCPRAISLASQMGDNIVSVDFREDLTLYPVEISIRAIDRYHLFIDLADCITNNLNLSIGSINTETVDSLVSIRITFAVHSTAELQTIINHITNIPGVDEVKRTR
ncbi:MAG: HD domain-containing protein [Muribaculaceae bacterium]|nr:HD domain-containing protein [Muribaculaceae bacterium]